MKHFDKSVTEEMRKSRDSHINQRWGQLYSLAKDAGESAIKYLFTVNAGGAVATLAYLGSTSVKNPDTNCIKISLLLFFLGIIFIGIYKAYGVHYLESLFDKYQKLVDDYYLEEKGWKEFLDADNANVDKSLIPYLLCYASFFCFIFGSIVGTWGLFF